MATSAKDAAHRNVIKFCFDLGMTPVETQKKLQLTEDHRHVSRSLVYKWHKGFEDGWTDSLNGKSGRQREINASTLDNVNDVIRSDRRQTVREVGEKLGPSKTSVHRVLNKDLSMNKVCAHWIPRLLTENEKERRVVASREFLLKNQRNPTFLDRIITVDKTWLHYYDPEDKRQSCVWKTAQSPPPKKAKVTKSMGKNMFIMFLDRKGVILCHSVPYGETVNSAYFSKVRLFVYTHCKWFMYNFREENVCIYFKYRMFDRLLHIHVLSTIPYGLNVNIPNAIETFIFFQLISRDLLRALRKKRPQLAENTIQRILCFIMTVHRVIHLNIHS